MERPRSRENRNTPRIALPTLGQIKISSEKIDEQIRSLISEGYSEGVVVVFALNADRHGRIVGFNRKQSGHQAADRFPLLVTWDGEDGTFEYAKSDLVLRTI